MFCQAADLLFWTMLFTLTPWNHYIQIICVSLKWMSTLYQWHLHSFHICTTGENYEENIPSTPSLTEPYHKILSFYKIWFADCSEYSDYSLLGCGTL